MTRQLLFKSCKSFALLMFLFLVSGEVAVGQAPATESFVSGRVMDMDSKLGLPTISIVNLTRRTVVKSLTDGSFTIAASDGDKLRLSHTTFQGKTVEVQLGEYLRVFLQPATTELSGVTIKGRMKQYQLDSAARADVYQRPLAREKTSSIMSPVSLLAEAFNKRSKQLQRFKREFVRMEDQRFVDVRYNKDLVRSLTLLTGDSLAAFMNSYQMPYEFARTAGELDVKMWVRNNYREWMMNPFVPEITFDKDTVGTANTREQ